MALDTRAVDVMLSMAASVSLYSPLLLGVPVRSSCSSFPLLLFTLTSSPHV